MILQTPFNGTEKEGFIAFEKRIQSQLDIYYKFHGHAIKRDSKRTHDLFIDGITVEEKIRSQKRNDIAIEIIQDMVSFSPGWLYTTKAIYIHYVMCTDGEAVELYKIDWERFKNWFLSNYCIQYLQGNYIVSPKGWGVTLNILVPISKIPFDFYQRFAIIEQMRF
jgi:hypothetical protein